MTEPDVDLILALAAIIREVDGNNSLGAAALAEEILKHPLISDQIVGVILPNWFEAGPPGSFINSEDN